MSAYWPQLEIITFFLLRIVVGILFIPHGAQKLFGAFGGAQGDGKALPLMSQMGLAGFLEFFGGLLILLGLFTRPAGFVLAGEMAVAYFMVHQRQALWPIQNKGEMAVLFCFAFLLFFAFGAGPWSLDALIWAH
ncbi:MAG: DoxX family protein [Armatimonadetes bacterium]|nr:DoxX family protein [Armatimonadota bacterium]